MHILLVVDHQRFGNIRDGAEENHFHLHGSWKMHVYVSFQSGIISITHTTCHCHVCEVGSSCHQQHGIRITSWVGKRRENQSPDTVSSMMALLGKEQAKVFFTAFHNSSFLVITENPGVAVVGIGKNTDHANCSVGWLKDHLGHCFASYQGFQGSILGPLGGLVFQGSALTWPTYDAA